MGVTLQGTVVKTYFSDAQFSAGVLATDDGARVRFRGRFYAAEGDRLAAIGQWTVDPKYGHQFEIKQLDYELPQTREGLINYLAKHPAFEGVGARTAEKIVDALGDGESLDVALRDRPEAFVAAGVPRKTILQLIESWSQHAGENAVRSYLAGFGLTHHQMQTLLEKFGTSIVSMLKHDPYLLIQHLAGYGFKKVDQIALKMGIAKTHPGRIEAALAYCLAEQTSNGHTWTPGHELASQANEVLVIDTLDSRDLIQAAGNRLLERGDLVADGCAVTSPGLHNDEQLVHRVFREHAWSAPTLAVDHTVDPDLGPDQREAFETALTSRMSVISGGAGTGKTFVVARLSRRFQEAGLTVSLCAPTGKAAKRIEQLLARHDIDLSASTIHRLLGYNGVEFREERIAADVLIVDEVSMVDVRLMAQLLRHLDLERTQLILVGDHNQLPPVGPGNVLRDIIQHNLVPSTIMTQVHRHAGVLKTNSVAVLEGTVAPSASDKQSRWMVIDRFREAPAIQTWLRDLMLDEIPNRLGFDPVGEVQIITPEHRGPLGTRALNQMMQHLLIARTDGPPAATTGRLLLGDKVIQTRNDYDLGVMNGTIGFVQAVGKEGLKIEFEGLGLIDVDWSKAKSVDLAYALTAHKAQGSEFPCAVVLCHKSHFFADRNWLYTAVTRASHTCVLIGDDYGLRRAARQVRNLNRRTLLSHWAARSQPAEEVAA
ncbi:MAG: AAA family ATPase [Phycisphaeraceae bacterium]|nr:AAA family ATPase [Phycisphaeraceae bacterium]